MSEVTFLWRGSVGLQQTHSGTGTIVLLELQWHFTLAQPAERLRCGGL